MVARQNASRGPVDWTEIRRRMELAGQELDSAGRATPERVRAILEERARVLARPSAPLPVGERLEVLTFVLANEIYAIESRYVHQVFRLQELAPLPGAELPVFGVTAWRGELLTIVDLRPVLGLRVAALDDLSRVIVLGAERPEFGILADAVREIVTLPAAEVRAPPEGLAAKRDYVRGMTGEAVLVLDARKLVRLTEPDTSLGEGVAI